MTEIAWLGHDDRQQRVMRALIDSQAEKGTIDELGLGTVRDAVADALYPGVSMLHRRARYLLFIAWAYRLVSAPRQLMSITQAVCQVSALLLG